MSDDEKELILPFIAIIPYKIQADDAIPDSVKLYFGQISALCQKYGYCWATDEQLSKMKNTSIKNIKRWNGILETSGYIVRETKNIPTRNEKGELHWRNSRKIHVNNAFSSERPLPKPKKEESEYTEKDISNNFSESPKNETFNDGPKNETFNDGLIFGTSTNTKPLSETFKVQPEPVVFSSLQGLDISETLKRKISESHEEEEVNIAVERTLRWKTRPTDEVGIMTTLRRADEWTDNPTKEEKTQSNQDFLKSLKGLDCTQINCYTVIVGNKYIEFTAGMKSVSFEIEEPDFKKKVTEYIEFLRNI